MKKFILLLSLFFGISIFLYSQGVNTWIPNGNGDWQVATNWSLGHIPLATEKVLITPTQNVIISNVPATSITQLQVTNSASKSVTLQASAPGNTLVITGGTGGIDLDLSNGNVVLNMTNGLNLEMAPGTDGQLEKTFSGNNVTFKPGSSFLISGNGTTSFSATNLTLNSDASGTASFAITTNAAPVFTVSGTTTVEQYLTGSRWHYISSPVSGATSLVFLNDYLRYYDEPAGDWSPYIVPTTVPLGDAQGFEVWTNSTRTATFTGPLHSGPYTASLTRTLISSWTPPDYNGWNLIGNPYPSAVDWESSGVTLTHTDPTIYYWNGTAYEDYNRLTHLGTGSRYIPPMQAFFVHVTQESHNWSTGSVNFTNPSRTNSSQLFYKDAYVFNDLLTLTASGNDYSDVAFINFNDTATSVFDWQLDSYKLFGIPEVPQVYSVLSDGINAASNVLPYAGKTTIVPVGFTGSVAGEYTLTAGQVETFNPAVQIMLEDILANVTQDLITDPVYTFSHDPLNNANRFLIHFYNPVLDDNTLPETSQPSIRIYSSGQTIYVNTNGLNTSGEVKLYDLLGRSIGSYSLKPNTLNKFDVSLREGYYLVTVVTPDQTKTEKVFIR